MFVKHQYKHQHVTAMGLQFDNPVGLAAGLDKNADYFLALASLGFGFIEVGTVTPRPQVGNPKPRLFRIPEDQALINRMGFNNKGVEYLIRKVEKNRPDCVLGINIGKNFDTPNDKAVDDYLLCLYECYPFSDYVTINISSPNTKNIRDLQHGDYLKELLRQLADAQSKLTKIHNKHVPLLLKLAPDILDEDIQTIATTINQSSIEGVIISNTSFARPNPKYKNVAGGLSGKPILSRSTELLAKFKAVLNPELAFIGLGGISSGQDALEKFAAGADLIQLYTGLIYRGPDLIKEIIDSVSS